MASYTKRPNGWTVRFRIIEYGVEVQKRLSGYPTKKAAEKAMAEYITTKKLPKASDSITFDQLVEDYFRRQEGRCKPSTIYSDRGRIEGLVLPTFSGKRVVEIKPSDIVNWQGRMNKLGYAFRYKETVYARMRAVFKHGAKYHGLPDPTLNVDNFRNLEQKKEMHVWTVEQFRIFLDTLKEVVSAPDMATVYQGYFACLFYGGMRKGEGMSLLRSDYDGAHINITKSCTQKVLGKPYEITTPKNAHSVRTIPVPRPLREILDSMPKLKKGEYLFYKDRPFPATTIDRIFKQTIEKSKLPPIRIHDLRHSCASWLLSSENGAPLSPVVVANYLGHTVDMLLTTYAHCLPNSDEEILRKF